MTEEVSQEEGGEDPQRHHELQGGEPATFLGSTPPMGRPSPAPGAPGTQLERVSGGESRLSGFSSQPDDSDAEGGGREPSERPRVRHTRGSSISLSRAVAQHKRTNSSADLKSLGRGHHRRLGSYSSAGGSAGHSRRASHRRTASATSIGSYQSGHGSGYETPKGFSPRGTAADTPELVEEALHRLTLADPEEAIREIEEEAAASPAALGAIDAFGSEEEVDFEECLSTDSEDEEALTLRLNPPRSPWGRATQGGGLAPLSRAGSNWSS